MLTAVSASANTARPRISAFGRTVTPQGSGGATCTSAPSANDLVRLLHPTPAVGCLPRTDEWLAKLSEYRSFLKVPGFFGAPFGFSQGDTQHMVVSIRGLAWQNNEITLPSGCGIVAGSAFDHEWRELRLKREAVVRLLGLD
jgi:menaquinone-specific isochorismate synthase